MRDHHLFAVRYTSRPARGHWEAQDDLRITGYGDPTESVHYYVARSAALAEVHWRDMVQYWNEKTEPTLLRVDRLGTPVLLLEM